MSAQKLIESHNKTIVHGGRAYRIIAVKLGSRVLADAEPMAGGDRINLVKTRSSLGKELRFRIENGLVS